MVQGTADKGMVVIKITVLIQDFLEMIIGLISFFEVLNLGGCLIPSCLSNSV